jgi:hypothetical protein
MFKRSIAFCLTSLLSLTSYFLLLTSPIYAQTKDWSDLLYESEVSGGQGGPGAATFKALEVIFGNILSVAFALAGFAAFIMLILGGFRYLTSAGDPKASAQARGTITWAIAGLLFLIGAWFILRLISEFTGIPGLLKFQVPSLEE